VWDFATLVRPQDCGGDGRCAEACPENLIRMDWIPVSRTPVLLEMLSCLRVGGPAPAQFRIDGEGIVRAVLKGRKVSAAALDAEARGRSPAPEGEDDARRLADWLERFHAECRAVDPRALEIVALRLEGRDLREIAERLGIGPRLVERILADLSC
jgi:ferredoxin